MKTSFEGETAESCPEMEDTNPELLQAQQILIREGKERDLHKYKYKAEFKSREKKKTITSKPWQFDIRFQQIQMEARWPCNHNFKTS